MNCVEGWDNLCQLYDTTTAFKLPEYYKQKQTYYDESMKEIYKSRFLASYGYCEVKTDLNNDGIQDKIYRNMAEYGAIYVLLGKCNEEKKDNFVFHSTLNGKIGGWFGASIAPLGDINNDGYNDIAVGAPFDGNGAVYIFNGCSEGLKNTQLIRAEHISKNIVGFGMSITPSIADNRFEGIIVGSFISGHAVLLRRQPVIRFNITSLKSNKHLIEQNDTYLYFHVCTELLCTEHIEGKLNLSYKIELDYTYLPENHTHDSVNVVTAWEKGHCDYLFVAIPTELEIFLLKSVTVSVTPSLKQDIRPVIPIWVRSRYTDIDYFNKFIPVEDKMIETEKRNITISSATNCIDDEYCYSDLSVICSLRNDQEHNYVNGSDNELRLDILVFNQGPDPAYATKLHIQVPKGVLPAKENNCITRSGDTEIQTRIICSLGNMVEINKSVSLSLKLHVSDVTKLLNISVEAKSKSYYKNRTNNCILFPLDTVKYMSKGITTLVIIITSVVIGILLLIVIAVKIFKVTQSRHTNFNNEIYDGLKRTVPEDTVYDDIGNVTQSHRTNLNNETYDGQKRTIPENTMYDDVGNETETSSVTASHADVATFHSSRHDIQDHDLYEFIENDKQYIYFGSSTTASDGEEGDNDTYDYCTI